MSGRLVEYSPITPGLRGAVMYKPDLTKSKPCKALTTGLKSTGGRNSHGRITCRFRGGGHKRRYRLINFKKDNLFFDKVATVRSIEYDPNRTATIALIEYECGHMEYMVAIEGLKVGDKVVTSLGELDIVIGNTMPAKFVPLGTLVCCVELKERAGAVLGRAAGTSVTIIGKSDGKAMVQMSSGEIRVVSGECFVTIGVVVGSLRKNQKLGKAGKNRWRGRRPHQRGVSMNPVDHPLGGGEGKSSGGRIPVSPWGQCAKGLRTRHNKRTQVFILEHRHKRKSK